MAGERGEAWVIAQFCVFGAIALAAILRLWPVRAIESWAADAIGVALVAGGLALIGLAWRALGPSFTPYPVPLPEASLTVKGPYRWVRHPIYGGLMLVAFGVGVLVADWLVLGLAAGLVILLWAKATAEERYLAGRYGDYATYAAQVRRRFVPLVV